MHLEGAMDGTAGLDGARLENRHGFGFRRTQLRSKRRGETDDRRNRQR
jgi:hypothetical protein